ncbi:MAG: FtsK/SpoIIIE domain-containing protein [Actinomycetota bacterium]|nr:FtsK/SpoIIIE domain-containing protein [Actinomycetota bacterium]
MGPPLFSVLLGVAVVVVAPQTPWEWKGLLLGALVCGLGVVLGVGTVWQVRRGELLRIVSDRLVPITGPVQLKVSRWNGVLFPRRVRITYGGGAPSGEPGFETAVVQIMQEVLGSPYEMRRHADRRRQIHLRSTDPVEVKALVDTRSPQQRRGEELLQQMLPGSTVTGTGINADGAVMWIEGSHQLGAKLAGGYRNRVEATFNRCMDGRWRTHWDMVADTFRFEVRPTFPERVVLEIPTRTKNNPLVGYDQVAIEIGIDEDGALAPWRPSKDPHLMVVGATGTGKTVSIRSVVMQLTALAWMVWVVDGKGTEFLGLRDWPNVQMVANRIPEQIAVINRAHQLMERRYEQIESGAAKRDDFEPVLLVVDEWADVRANLLAWYAQHKPKGAPSKPTVLDQMGSLARKGRTARIHMVFGTQRPDAEYFGGDMRDNFRMRLSMGRLSVQGAQMMWESPSIGVSLPRGKRGRATAVNVHGQPAEIQTFFVPDPYEVFTGTEDDHHLQQLRPHTIRHPRMVVIPPASEADLDSLDGAVLEPDYWDYVEAKWGWASDHPDLDMVAIAAARERSTDGTHASSAAAMFGLTRVSDVSHNDTQDDNQDEESYREPSITLIKTDERELPATSSQDLLPASVQHVLESGSSPTSVPGMSEPLPPRPTLSLVRTTDAPQYSDDASDGLSFDADGEDPWDGYADPDSFDPSELNPGWLVLEDESTDHWVVLDDVGEDPLDPGAIACSWRDDDDQDGVFAVPADGHVIARPPVDEQL